MSEVIGHEVVVLVGMHRDATEYVEAHPADDMAKIDEIANAMLEMSGCDCVRVYRRRIGSADMEEASGSLC